MFNRALGSETPFIFTNPRYVSSMVMRFDLLPTNNLYPLRLNGSLGSQDLGMHIIDAYFTSNCGFTEVFKDRTI